MFEKDKAWPVGSRVWVASAVRRDGGSTGWAMRCGGGGGTARRPAWRQKGRGAQVGDEVSGSCFPPLTWSGGTCLSPLTSSGIQRGLIFPTCILDELGWVIGSFQ